MDEITRTIVGIIEDATLEYDIAEKLDSKITDLGADSLDYVEITLNIETEYSISIPDSDYESLKTPRQFIDYVKDKLSQC